MQVYSETFSLSLQMFQLCHNDDVIRIFAVAQMNTAYFSDKYDKQMQTHLKFFLF